MMIKKQLGVLAAAVALASSANAAFDTGAAVLYAWDSDSNNSYFVDLGVTGQALVDGSTVNTTDSGLGSFLTSNPNATWSVISTINDTDKVANSNNLPSFLAGGLSLINSGIVGTSLTGSPVGTTGGVNASQQSILNAWMAVIQTSAAGSSSFGVDGTDPAAADGSRNGTGLNASMISVGTTSALFYAQANTSDGVTLATGATEVSQLGGSGSGAIIADFADLTASGNFTAVSAVPVPAAAWLFGSALAGLVVARRRK